MSNGPILVWLEAGLGLFNLQNPLGLSTGQDSKYCGKQLSSTAVLGTGRRQLGERVGGEGDLGIHSSPSLCDPLPPHYFSSLEFITILIKQLKLVA